MPVRDPPVPRWTTFGEQEVALFRERLSTYGTDAANVLFHVVNERSLKKRPMIFTTNKALSRWGQVLHDDDLAETITDRILERGRHIKLDGVSYRTRHLAVDAVGDGGDHRDRRRPGHKGCTAQVQRDEDRRRHGACIAARTSGAGADLERLARG